MESGFITKKPRKLTDEEIAKWKKRLAVAEPYPETDEAIFDGPSDINRELATLAKKALEDDRKYYPEYYQDK